MSEESFDLIIIGAGVSGIGVAQVAKQMGLRFRILEQGRALEDCSTASMRIIHGGFRYLQSLDFPRVLESISAKKKLLQDYPEHIEAFPCAFALDRIGLKSALPMRCASLLYRVLAASLGAQPGNLGVLSEQEAKAIAHLEDARFGAFTWTDARIRDRDGFFTQLREELRDQLSESTEVRRIDRKKDFYEVSCQEALAEKVYRTKTVVNASGAGLLNIQTSFPTQAAKMGLRWSKGFNLRVKNDSATQVGIGRQGPKGNLLFLSPRAPGELCFGTWYLPPVENPRSRDLEQFEIEAALSDFTQAFPSLRAQASDVLGVEVGYIPALGMKLGKNGEEVQTLHREKIFDNDAYVEIVSTKLTTFQMQAQTVCKILKKYL